MADLITITLPDGTTRSGRLGWALRYVELHPDAKLEAQEPEAAQAAAVDAVAERFPEIPQPVLDALVAAGFSNRQAIDQASDADLLAVEGLGPATLAKLRAGGS